MIPLDRPLILASGSPRRSDLLRSVGLTFTVRPADLDEQPQAGEAPEVFVARMAREKAEHGRRDAPHRCLLLGCDTVVVLGRQILGKPRDRAEGRRMLRTLAGRSHLVLSAIALLLLPEDRWAVGLSETQVFFNPIPAAALESYLDTGEFRDKAGAYALQGAASLFVERIQGSATNVIGLPLELFPRLLREFGLWFPEA
jgi:septum formation protein